LKQFDEVLKYVNELSGTIDLKNTRARAEALFRRFQRTIETVDRKKAECSGLPSPGKSPISRTLGSSSATTITTTTMSATTTGGDGGNKPETEIPEISEDLRRLLSKEVIRP